MQVGIDAQDVRQRHRIGVVGLRTSHRRPFPIAGHGHRVDREHRPPTGTQGGDQQSARSLDRDRDRVLGAVAGVGEHLDQSGEPGRVVADALFGHQLPITADDCDVVMPFSPVDSAVAVQSSTSINSGVPLVRTQTRTRSALLTSLSGLPPMSCSRSQHTRTAPVSVRARWLSTRLGASGRASGLEPRAIPPARAGRAAKTHRAVPSAVGALPSALTVCQKGLAAHEGRSHRASSSERRADRPRTKPVDRPTRGPVLTRRPCQSAHRSRISRF